MPTTQRIPSLLALPLVLALACAGDDGAATTTAATGGSASASSTSGKTTTASSTTADISGSDATTDGTGTSTTGTSTTDTSTTGDTGVFPDWCNYWDDLCPEGTKCTFDGDIGKVQCVDIDRAPKAEGEACTREGTQFDGLDDCDDGLICWGGVDNEGTCVPFCALNSPFCEAQYDCTWCQECALGVCVPTCDPLADDCPEETLCVPTNDSFSCVQDAGGEMPGAYGDPCEFINTCDAGLFCASPELVPDCEGVGCCASYCSTDDPQCPDLPGVDCVAWWEEGQVPDGFSSDLGVCILPP
jgi:hypothetical protein